MFALFLWYSLFPETEVNSIHNINSYDRKAPKVCPHWILKIFCPGYLYGAIKKRTKSAQGLFLSSKVLIISLFLF